MYTVECTLSITVSGANFFKFISLFPCMLDAELYILSIYSNSCYLGKCSICLSRKYESIRLILYLFS